MAISVASLLYSYLSGVSFDLLGRLTTRKVKRYNKLFTGKILDIGAGDAPYKPCFTGAAAYITTNTRRHYTDKTAGKVESLTDVWIEDGTALPFERSGFDGAVCFQVLSVIEKPGAFFSEVNRVLKPGGTFMLSTDFLYPKWSAEDRFRHSDRSLREMAEAGGFEVIALESYGGFGTMIYRMITRFLLSFPGIWTGMKNPAGRLASGLLYGFMLLLLPVISLKGMIIFLLERNVTNRFDFASNLLLVCRKQAE